eukprot:6207085-Pleurochrysis_carterae.AAC.7
MHLYTRLLLRKLQQERPAHIAHITPFFLSGAGANSSCICNFCHQTRLLGYWGAYYSATVVEAVGERLRIKFGSAHVVWALAEEVA